jgi:UDP-N-acetylmuramoyl-L-alanyl-D-glutamate--2,6-diaminopimelate ligase
MLQQLASIDAATNWLRARVTGTLRTDSRQVCTGDAFIAWPGWATDGRRFVADALAAGAAACLVEADGVGGFGFSDERVAALAGLKAAAGPLADRWFGRPSERLSVVATTGTNGKTSTACWTADSLACLGRRCGVIGTLGIGEPGAFASTGLTTPDPVTLQRALRAFVDRGFDACALEASSIGLVEHRLDGVHVDVALFTNFTRDHLDYHGSMEAYWAAKRRLFDAPGLKAAVINVDDAQGRQLADELQRRALDLWTVSVGGPARLAAQALRYAATGLAFDVVEGGGRAAVSSTLVGDYNASNLLVVLGALRALGVPLADAAAAVAGVGEVPGRMQRLSGAGIEVVVDYAHSPDALAKVLAALRPLARARRGRLVCLFGCGGNRDATKRPLMGAIAARDADRVILTSDNPRDEPPGLILSQILAGASGHDEIAVIENRAQAIATAIAEAGVGDVVLLAGKGHEDYQEIAGQRRPFSDLAEARTALVRRDAAAGAAA